MFVESIHLFSGNENRSLDYAYLSGYDKISKLFTSALKAGSFLQSVDKISE